MSCEAHIIFCMAGVYQRFRDAGYVLPKFLLPLRGGAVLEAVVRGLVGQSGAGAWFVANERDRAHEASLESVLRGAGLDESRVTWVADTRGQAHTAAIGVEAVRGALGVGAMDVPVMFHNIDTIVEGRDVRGIARALAQNDGYIDCFDSDQAQYSYVRAVECGKDGGGAARGIAVEVAEKIVISRRATSGLYGFRSGAAYLRAYEGARAAGREFYISDVYRAMLAQGARIEINLDDTGHATTIVGTPAEYLAHATEADLDVLRRMGMRLDAKRAVRA